MPELVQVTFKKSSRWEKALKYDGMPPGTKFAVFSDNNPYEVASGRAYKLYCSIVNR